MAAACSLGQIYSESTQKERENIHVVRTGRRVSIKIQTRQTLRKQLHLPSLKVSEIIVIKKKLDVFQ